MEQRVRVRPDRFRIPDVCVVQEKPTWRGIVTQPPYLCVEILSPDDKISDTLEKVGEYLASGIAYVWVIDPSNFTGFVYTQNAIVAIENGIFRTDRFEIDLSQVEL